MMKLSAARLIPWAGACCIALAASWIAQPLFAPEQPVSTSIALNEPQPPQAGNSQKPVDRPAPAPLSQRIVEYHIGAALEAGTKTIQGQQTMTWTNPGAQPVGELYFHLYPNAFKSKDSTFMQESGGKLRKDRMKEGSYGQMDILSMKTAQGESLKDRIEYVQPDDGNKKDTTLIKLTLPNPVNPGEKITLHTDFTVKLPAVFARMGYSGDFVMAGQWFPKIAVYETKGTRGRSAEGWNLHQYHGNSEFYADFGIYNVKIKVPSNYTVAATGFPTRSPAVEEAGTKTYQFYGDDIHDFAWAASPNFQYVEESFSAPGVPGVKIKLYLDPDHAEFKNRYMAAAKKSLSDYSQWYGTYPYSTLSIVVPPKGGNGAGGMEYPTLVTGWGADEKNTSLELERVIVHEIGHQYFYGMVASNEFEEAWLDEGFTSYAEDKVMQKEYGARSNTPMEASYITAPESLQRNAWDFKTHDNYAENVYTRGKLVLLSIEQQLGKSGMEKVLRTYVDRYKFRHPSTKDFQKVLEEVTKMDWQPFFEQYVYGGMMSDYAVDRISFKKSDTSGSYESTVTVRRLGGQYSSVPIEFHFRDGSMMEKAWDGRDAEIQFKITNTTPVDWVSIDPRHSMILENKRINNFMKTRIDPKWNIRLSLGTEKIIETLFGWVAW